MTIPSHRMYPSREEDSLSYKLAGTEIGGGVGAAVTLLGALITGHLAVAEKYATIGPADPARHIDTPIDFIVGKGPAILGVCIGVGIIADMYRAWNRYKSREKF